jgi:hypothetical protein
MVAADIDAGTLAPVLPGWRFEPLPVTLLTASRRLMPAKTRPSSTTCSRPCEWARSGLLSRQQPCSPASSSTVTPSSRALSSLLPASPATT